ncbi:MAG TPA: terminase family protein [Vicinamibacterales bacterium]|nr:terminase family protein [Vicinamibacterales bacterium]
MLLCPPQHGKSEASSRKFPAYVLGRDPKADVISASATAELAEGFGRDVRNCVASPEYRNIFPDTRLAEDSQAKGRWNTRDGGSYYAVGVGGHLFGRGGMAIVDDPVGSWTDAQSELTRDTVWEWYRGSLYNRIRPGQPIILIQHRTAEDDLAGRLIEQQNHGGDKWEIVELPADVNDPPWIERYDRAALERIRANTDPRQWAALYLQNPTPDEGTFFKREWFEFVDPKKVEGHRYTSGDFAVTEGDGDFTELGTHAYSGDTLTLSLEGWRGQTTADVWIERLIDQFATHKPLCFFGESGPIRRSVEPFLKRRMAERKKFCRLEWLTRSGDKPTMARALQAMASAGKVKIADTEYGHHLLAQLLAFPAGRLDDGADMAILMAMAIGGGEGGAHPAIVSPKAVEKKRSDGWDDDNEVSSWKVA